MKFHSTIEEAISQLKGETNQSFTDILQHGSMSVEYYAPEKVDNQTPHKQDEIYVVASGHSFFNRNGAIIECKTGDVIFVPAAMEHHFFDFSDDFAVWVIFYGTCGGEQSGT